MTFIVYNQGVKIILKYFSTRNLAMQELCWFHTLSIRDCSDMQATLKKKTSDEQHNYLCYILINFLFLTKVFPFSIRHVRGTPYSAIKHDVIYGLPVITHRQIRFYTIRCT